MSLEGWATESISYRRQVFKLQKQLSKRQRLISEMQIKYPFGYITSVDKDGWIMDYKFEETSPPVKVRINLKSKSRKQDSNP